MWFYYLIMAIGVSVGTGAFVAYNAEQKATLAIAHEEPEVNAEQAAKVTRALRRLHQTNPGDFPSPRGNRVARIPQRLIDQALRGGLAAPNGIVFEINSSGQILTRVNARRTDINEGGYQSTIDRIGPTPNTDTMNRNSRRIPGSGTYDFVNEERISLNNPFGRFGKGAGHDITDPANGSRPSDDDVFSVSRDGTTVTPPNGGGGDTGHTVDPDNPHDGGGNGGGGNGGGGNPEGPGSGDNPDDGGGNSWEPLVIISQFTNPSDNRYPFERRLDAACTAVTRLSQSEITKSLNRFGYLRKKEGISADQVRKEQALLGEGVASLIDYCYELHEKRQTQGQIEAINVTLKAKNELAASSHRLRTKTDLYKNESIYSSRNKQMKRVESWVEAIIDAQSALASYPIRHGK